MQVQSVSQVWTTVEATVTIRLVGNDNHGSVLVVLDAGHLQEDHVLSLAIQALVNKLVDTITPPPCEVLCPDCQVAPIKRSAADGSYSVWMCPSCHALLPVTE
jgi:hypothetical protein